MSSVEPQNFTQKEVSRSQDNAWRVLARFVLELPLLCKLAVPSIVLAIVGTGGIPGFTWLSGVMSNCGSLEHCVAPLPFSLPYFGRELQLTISFLLCFAIVLVLIRITGWIAFEIGGQFACLPLFSKMMRSLANTRTTFFDEHPSGRIINRVVRDFEQLRFMGPIRIGDSLNAIIELLVIACVVGLAHPLAGLAVLPTLAVFLYIQRQVAPMMQHCIVQRSIRFGEVLHRETDAIEGIRIFHLYGQHQTLFKRLKIAMTSFTQMHLLRAQIEAWGRFWSTVASSICSFAALAAVAVALDQGRISVAFAAVIVTSVFRLAGVFGWLTWSLGYLFESAGHARRIFEYVDLPKAELEERADKKIAAKSDRYPQTIPAGDLIFERYTMSYRPDTATILDDVSMVIPRGKHVGIIGRTGAGKSSLVQALFRMVYLKSGDIRIGSASIFEMPLDFARSLFAVMPQDPYLFAGTIRSNLDPYKIHSDMTLIAVLTDAQLSFDLYSEVHEAGKNFSLGQRQLIGLARVLLSKAPFVIMDEPTSSVDSITDAVVQTMLKTALKDRTVLTIAHRVETLALTDLVIELDAGKVSRVGPPSEILKSISPDML